MATWFGFLRAINLGAKRKFAKGDIAACVENLGFTGVATHINTGNVRFDTTWRSRAKIETALEGAFAADRGFEVPSICFSLAELARLGADVAELGEGHTGKHYVSLLKDEPGAEQLAAIEKVAAERGSEAGERLVVRGRAAHLLLGQEYHTALLTNSVVERALGVATNRNATVIRAIIAKWG